ncbi:MAG: ROK family protein [Rhodobacter sp.]|nr:ROK family protein [Rhodobacter sp.]
MPARPADTYSLVADIGGTNTRVALADGLTLLPETVKRYRNKNYPGLETVLTEFLDSEGGVDCSGACVAVAGPVRDGVGELTNLDWRMDKDTLARATRAETVAILNDLQAQGHALGYLSAENLRVVIPTPDHSPQAVKLVVGVGTGFNAAAVYEAGQGRLVTPSEAGHSTMPVRSEADLRLSQYVETFHGIPGVEDVLSGRGLERIYRWLAKEDGETAEKLAADIMAAVADGSDPRASAAAEVFVRLLGIVTGNLALIYLPFGGVYLSGGVSRAFAPYLEALRFDDWFRDKGRFAGFMQNFGVSVIEDDFAALTGCASHLAALG